MIKNIIKSKFVWFILLLILARLVAPIIFLHQINRYLDTFSPVYFGKIEDFDMALWRGAYSMQKMQLTLREKPITFFKVDNVEVSIAWREIFKGKIKTDIDIYQMKFLYSDYVIKKVTEKPKENVDHAKQAGSKLFPVSIERIQVFDSSIDSTDFFGVTDKLPVLVTGVNGEVSNLTPTSDKQISYFKLTGFLPKKAPVEFSGLFNLTLDPVDWETKLFSKDFELTTVNPWMYHVVPLTFEKGSLTLFAEAKSTAGKIKGYAKPFAKEVAFIGDEKDFKGFKQFGIEIGLAALNLFFREAKDKTVAAKVDFTHENEKFDWSFWQVLKSLFENGYKDPLKPSFEESPVDDNKKSK